MNTKYIKIHWGDLPVWIVPALINNDLTGLTQPEIEGIPELEQIFSEMAKDADCTGYNIVFSEDSEPCFINRPEIGPPSLCVPFELWAKADFLTSDQILEAEDLYSLQDSFSSSGTPFKYKMTSGEIAWYNHISGKYCITDWINENLDCDILTFDDPEELKEVLLADQMHPKAVMLSDETALQRLFFWLS